MWLQSSLAFTYLSVPAHIATESLVKTFQEVEIIYIPQGQGNATCVDSTEVTHVAFTTALWLHSPHTEALVRELSSLTKFSKESKVCWSPYNGILHFFIALLAYWFPAEQILFSSISVYPKKALHIKKAERSTQPKVFSIISFNELMVDGPSH